MQRAARIDIFFGIREEGDIDGELIAPLGPQLPSLKLGNRYLIELCRRVLWVLATSSPREPVTQTNSGLKSRFDGDRIIGRSGALGKQGEVGSLVLFYQQPSA